MAVREWLLCVCVCVLALGMGLCIAFIALVRLPSLKVSTLLLVGLLIYDVFWVCPSHVLCTHFTFLSLLLWPPCVADEDIISLPCGFYLSICFFLA